MAGGLEEATEWMQLAERSLEAGRALVLASFYREAVSRAYYAMFYAAKAAVVLEGLDVGKHSAVISAFGRRVAGTGRVPAHLHRVLLDAFKDRQGADYTLAWVSTGEHARRRLDQAEEFVAEVRKLLA